MTKVSGKVFSSNNIFKVEGKIKIDTRLVQWWGIFCKISVNFWLGKCSVCTEQSRSGLSEGEFSPEDKR